MVKRIFIGSGIAFGAVAVVAGTVSCDAAKNNTGNEIKPEEKPNFEQQEKEKANFIQALKNSSFTKPIKFELPIMIEHNASITIDQEIINSLSYRWSSSGRVQPININKVGSEYVISLNKEEKFINDYATNLFGQTWLDIMKGQGNKDFQNIYQVNYGFKLVETSKTLYQLIPTYTQVFFEHQPSWLKENNFSVSLLENKELISTLNLTFKP